MADIKFHSDINGPPGLPPPRRRKSYQELPNYCLDDCCDVFEKMSLYDSLHESWDDEEDMLK